MIDETIVRHTIATLKPNGQLFEVRAIDGKWNASGYFTSADTLIAELKKVRNRKNLNWYITLNVIKDECYSRNQRDKIIEYATPTTGDTDILAYDWLMIDIDPRRATGTSSADEQIEQSKSKANAMYSFLRSRGWSDPIVSMSGNGIHLLYQVSFINNPENAKIMQNCLTALDMLFSDDQVQIDTKTFNPARICKLYGTVAQKGANSPERPHRMSFIVKSGKIADNDKSLLESLVALMPEPIKPEKYNNYKPREFDLRDWISRQGLNVKTESSWSGGTKWILEECPFDASHKGKDAAIIQTSDGKICFNCFHNSCAGNKWRELRLKYEPDAYDRQFVEHKPHPNYRNPDYKVVTVKEERIVDGEPIFYTTEQIRLLKRPPEEFIKAGVSVIDKKMRGWKKGFVTCLSGLRGCGKSSFIDQTALEAADQGYKVALFSGELTEKNLYSWLILNAAGSHYVHETQYENYYRVNNDAELLISKWLDEKIFIYNNHYGNDFSEIMQRLNKCVADHKVDLVILDNLMALNISMLDFDKYQRQSVFVEQLETFAKNANIHIIFVAHPRKSEGFLRLDDIAGSGDITNRVDNAMILHRVNEDFKRESKKMFKWKDSSVLYQCSNVIEICKDRDGGVQDEFVPLYFDGTCKRLKNTEYENKMYGWQEESAGAGFADEPF